MLARGASAEAESIGKALLLIKLALPDAYSGLAERAVALRLGNAAGAAAYTSGSYANGWLGRPQTKLSNGLRGSFFIAFVLAHESVHAERVSKTVLYLPLKYNAYTFMRDWFFREYPHEEELGFRAEVDFAGYFGIEPLPGEGYFIKESHADVAYYGEKWDFVGAELIGTVLFNIIPAALIIKAIRRFRDQGSVDRRSSSPVSVSNSPVSVASVFIHEPSPVSPTYRGWLLGSKRVAVSFGSGLARLLNLPWLEGSSLIHGWPGPY